MCGGGCKEGGYEEGGCEEEEQGERKESTGR